MNLRFFSKKEPENPGYFQCLKGKDVISANISDHHPLIHHGVLFWNMMMQGKKRNGEGYNNGFGLIESDKQYICRIMIAAEVIAEIISLYPDIEVISLCEAPVKALHVHLFLQAFNKFDLMDKFFMNSSVDAKFPNWGLLLLVDKKYEASNVAFDDSTTFEKLANRFQVWRFVDDKGKNKFFAFGHFPFGEDARITDKQKLSSHGKTYCHFVKTILNKYADEQLILCADFNLNPYLISEWSDRAMDLIVNNNSVLLASESGVSDAVTVDGILLSRQEKQKYSSSRFNFGLFTRLKNENKLLQTSFNEHLIANRSRNIASQRAYDERFGVILR